MPSFDTPSTSEVLVEDVPTTPPVVDVNVVNAVRVDELPTKNSYQTVVLQTGAKAVKILNANPMRKRVILWMLSLGTGGEAVIISNRKGDADAFRGAAMYSPNAITRYEITEKEELYAVGCDPTNSGGTNTGFVASTDDVLLSVIEEYWAS